MPPEWEAWLRYRRDTKPTDEEIARNISMANVKKQRAAESAARDAAERGEQVQSDQPSSEQLKQLPVNDSAFSRYPRYEEYERVHRHMADRKKDPYYDKKDGE